MNRPAVLAPETIEGRARPFKRVGVACGRRGFLLLVVGFAWLVPAFADVRFAWAMLAWDGFVVGAWLIDVWRLPAPGALTIRRVWLAPAALSVESDVEITLTNHTNVPISARVLDAVPRELRAAPAEVQLHARPQADVQARYTIRPSARGRADVGDAYLRYQSFLRIAERWAKVDLAQTVTTCPNIEEAKRHSIFLIRSRQIELEKRSTRLRGTGRTFESLREYRQGDEFRDICWTASARRGKLATRVFEIERSQTIWLLLDSGRLMRARVGGLSKLDYSVNAALALSQVALNGGDRVGLLAYGRRITQRLPASRGSAHLTRIIDGLASVQEDEWEADHVQAASRLLTDQKRRSLVVWLTDLAETATTPEVVRAVSQLMAHHVVLFVVIGQPDLQALARRRPESVGQMFEGAAAQELVHRRELLLAKLHDAGALVLETSSTGLALALVNSYLDIKQRGRL